MKIATILTTAVLLSSAAYSQNMLIHKSAGSVVTVKLSEIDSITFVSDTSSSGGTVTDIDGNVYKIVTIGTQKWMAENLKVTKYRNGDLIGTTTPASKDISTESSPKYQWAYNGTANADTINTYGRLYTWYAVTDNRSVCPTGWHIRIYRQIPNGPRLQPILEAKALQGER